MKTKKKKKEDTKGHKKNVSQKKQLKFKNYKNCSEATHLESRINYLEINKINIDSFFCYKRRHKEFIKSNKLIIKTQRRFKSERHNVLTEEIRLV